MVKPLNPEDMKLETEAAAKLREETSGGLGDPLSRRLAEAIIENNENMRKQNELIASYTEAISDSAEKAAVAGEDAERAACIVEYIAGSTLETVKSGTVLAVTEAIPKQVNDLVAQSQESIIKSAEWASTRIKETGEEAAESIRRSQEVNKKRELRANKESFFFALGGIGKLIYTILVIGTVTIFLFAGWRCLPIVTGEAQITYTEAYRSELDKVTMELITTRNELEAYKKAFTVGLKEQSLHDLNEKNESDLSAYEESKSNVAP